MTGVYLDWNATAPPLACALEATARAERDTWGNAASVHFAGRRARRVLEASRATIANCLGSDPSDLTFTSGGTEANNLALHGLCSDGVTLLTSRLEHPSIVRVAEHLPTRGVRVRWVNATPSGVVDLDCLEAALRESSGPGAAVVAVQAVNHETGVLQPLAEVTALCRRWGALLHVDAVQAVGKTAVAEWREADTVAVAAHKLGGPKGIGAVRVAGCVRLRPLLLGGAQESGIRPGTVAAGLAAGFAAAAEWAMSGPHRYASVHLLRDRLERALVALGGEVNGSAPRVPHVTNVSFPRIDADELVAALDMEGVAVSSGSACSSGTAERSAVITAMLGEERARGAVRASLGDTTSEGEVDQAIAAWRRVVTRACEMDEVLLEVCQATSPSHGNATRKPA